MKTKKFNKRLVLHKKTIAHLSGSAMKNVNGGDPGNTEIMTECAGCTVGCGPTNYATCAFTCDCTGKYTECVTVSPCICN